MKKQKSDQINKLLDELTEQGFSKEILISIMDRNFKTSEEKIKFLQNYKGGIGK